MSHPGSITCSWIGTDGRQCGQITGLVPDRDGNPRCAWHDPDRARARKARRGTTRKARAQAHAEHAYPVLKADELPIKTVESLEDAEKLAQWAILQTALGRLHPRAAMAVAGLCREYRMVHSEADASRRLNELAERVKAARARGVDV